MTISITPLDISDVLKATDSLYVVNNTDLQRSRPKGTLHIVARDEAGEEVVINLPKTWIPINLASYCDVKSVTRSQNFRDLLRKSIVYAVSDDQAKTILSSGAGLAEHKRVMALENMVSKATGGAQPTEITIFGGDDTPAQTPATAKNAPLRDTHVEEIVSDFNAGMDDEALSKRIPGIIGDKDSWIWASQQIKDTGSLTYLAISDKLGEFAGGR